MVYYKIVISPETIKGDLFNVDYNNSLVGYYSAMTRVLSGGTKGSSLLKNLTIPILLTETVNDYGYYDPFDGEITQKDTVTNFFTSGTTLTPYTINLYNTSEQYQKFIEFSKYYIDWGDSSPIQTVNQFAPNFISHTYPTASSAYTITLEQVNNWGKVRVSKEIVLPYRNVSNRNPLGNRLFTPPTGNWSATPTNYNFIFTGDSKNNIDSQVSSNYVNTPFIISGYSFSRLAELEQYGSTEYVVNKPVYKNRDLYGTVTNIDVSQGFTAYTIQGIDYYDYSDGTTLFFMSSSGFTPNNIVAQPITKQDVLINVIDQPQIQTNVYIERGKNSAYERVQRIGEVDNLGDMINYGYGFFNVEKRV